MLKNLKTLKYPFIAGAGASMILGITVARFFTGYSHPDWDDYLPTGIAIGFCLVVILYAVLRAIVDAKR